MSDQKGEACCSFCGATGSSVNMLIAGNNVYICSDCVEKCTIAIDKHNRVAGKEPINTDNNFQPKDIKKYLDDYVVGQEEAKVTISVAAYNHYKRINNPTFEEVEIEKSNILMLGPTGSGKTLLAQSLARCLKVPCVIFDATSLTEAGYVGDDTEAVIGRLLSAANGDVSAAERGIVFIDEIDKKRTQKFASNGRDVTGEGVQQALLRMLEGTEVTIKGNDNKGQKVNTQNILFILSGAFVDLEKIGKDRKVAGFCAEKSIHASEDIPKPETFIKYGMIPELVGRLPVVTKLQALNEEQLKHVLTQPKNAITKQYAALFKIDGVNLEFTDEALSQIAKKAIEDDTGARGLRSVIEKHLTKVQFDLPSFAEAGVDKVVFDKGLGDTHVVTLFDSDDKVIENKALNA